MAENKTVANDGSVEEFLNTVPHDRRREEARTVMARMADITGQAPRMWGPSLIGFDQYHYKYDSGREGDFFMVGLSPRKTALTVYVMPGFDGYEDLLDRLGPHKTGRSCLYISNLSKIDAAVLDEIIEKSYVAMKAKYPGS